LDVFVVEDVTISKDGDLDGLLDSLDLLPVGQTLRPTKHKAQPRKAQIIKRRANQLCFFFLLTSRTEKEKGEETYRQLTLHIPRPPMTRQDLRSGRLEHLGVGDGLLDVVVDSELCGDGDIEVLVKMVDCSGRTGRRG
jgi:hypothetical protein